jgi:phage FluMu protein Com
MQKNGSEGTKFHKSHKFNKGGIVIQQSSDGGEQEKILSNNMIEKIELKDVDCKCPNCKAVNKAAYDKKMKRPSIYGECWFCQTLFHWTKMKVMEIIPASRKQYIINTKE